MLIASAVLLGCGGSAAPEAVLKDFFTAVGENDTKAACALLSKEQRITDTADGACEDALFLDPRPDVLNRIESGDYDVKRFPQDRTATVVVAGQEAEYEFAEEDGKWRLVAIGSH